MLPQTTKHNEVSHNYQCNKTFWTSELFFFSEMSLELLERFENAETLVHSGGHFIPSSSQHKQVYLSFLDKVLSL